MGLRILFIFLFVFSFTAAVSQDDKQPVIQLTGVLFGSDSTTVIPGTHIYIPKSGRGTTSNPYGFFSLPVLEGDSVIFSAVGYKRAYFIVPKHDQSSSLRIIIALQDDITFLEEVEIRPYPTEHLFKEAIISMELPHQREYANIYQWLNSQVMAEAYQNLPASPNANHQYFMDQQRKSYVNRYSPPQNQLLNPFAWRNFINSLKRKK